MKIPVLIATLIVCLQSPGLSAPTDYLNKTIAELKLEDGTVYKDAKMTKIEADAVTVMHPGGVVRIAFERFTEAQRKALGFDPEKARAERERRQEMATNAVFQSSGAETPSLTETTADKSGTFIILQVIEGGYLVNTYTRGGPAGSMARAMSALGGSSRSFVPPSRGEKVIFLKGEADIPLVDEDVIDVAYSESDEVFKYETNFGTSTVTMYHLHSAKK